MTKKNFVIIAGIIKNLRAEASGHSAESLLCEMEIKLNDYFKMINDNFSEDIFLKACK